MTHLQENGFEVETIDLNDLRMIKSMSGIKPEQASCHTAKVGGYTIEEHVPADDIKRLLAERPEASGLTVPGMPKGSPGMEVPRPDHYQVLLLGRDGSTEVFSEHRPHGDGADSGSPCLSAGLQVSRTRIRLGSQSTDPHLRR